MSERIRDLTRKITDLVQDSSIMGGMRSRLEERGIIRRDVSELELTSSERAEIFYSELAKKAEDRDCTELDLPMRVMDRTARRWGFKDAVDASRTHEWSLQHQRNMEEFTTKS